MSLDWFTFYEAGRAVLEGISPYTVSGYFNPPLLAYILAPSTMLPFSIWMPFMITVSCFTVILLARKRSLFLLLSPLVIQALTWGSVDLLLMGGMSVSWGFLVLKPQLLFIALPVILQQWSRRNIAIAGLMLTAYPPHYVDWFRAIQTTKHAHQYNWSANLSALGPVMMVIGLLLTVGVFYRLRSTPHPAKLVMAILSPVSRMHDYIIAWESLASLKMLLATWGIFIVWYHLETRNEVIFTLLGLGVFIRELLRRKQDKPIDATVWTHRQAIALHIFYLRPPYKTTKIGH